MQEHEIRRDPPAPTDRYDVCMRDLVILLVHLAAGRQTAERLVGTARRELLDQIPFWSAGDLERKLLHFSDYYNRDRVHGSLRGATPACKAVDVNRRIGSACISGSLNAAACISYPLLCNPKFATDT